MRLTEKYRPEQLADVVGQPKACKVVNRMMTVGLGGRALWVQGPSATGKTTLARIMAKSVANMDFDYLETVGREVTCSMIHHQEHRWQMYPAGRCHVWVVNEAHGLSKPSIELFLDVLERLGPHVLVVFTTTNDGADLFEGQLDAGPFASRCIMIRTTKEKTAKPFAERVKWIAESEDLDGKPDSAYVSLARKHGNNIRAMINDVEAGAMLD